MRAGVEVVNNVEFNISTQYVTGERTGYIFQIYGVGFEYRHSSRNRFLTSEAAYSAAVGFVRNDEWRYSVDNRTERIAFENLPNDSMLTAPTDDEREMHRRALEDQEVRGDDDLYDEDDGMFI